MTFASALSVHPLATEAVGEVVGHLLDQGMVEPDLVVVFVSAAHTGVLDEVVATIRALLRPRTLVGCTTSTVVGGSREVEGRPALSAWAASHVDARPLRLEAGPGGRLDGLDPEALEGAAALVLLADPFTFPAETVLDALAESGLDTPVVGGLASAASSPGGNRLVLDDRVHRDGGVGLVLRDVEVTTVVSQGCRPIGEPLTVTAGEGRLVAQLAGQPALERLEGVLQRLGPNDLALARRGLHVGRVVESSKLDYERGDFLVRSVLGADRGAGVVAVGDQVSVGDTLQFHVRDAASADEDLRALLARQRADAALLFTCNGRGTHLFGVPDHDAAVLAEALGDPPVAGMSCAGEIGPVGGRSFLHGFTASVVLFSGDAEVAGDPAGECSPSVAPGPPDAVPPPG